MQPLLRVYRFVRKCEQEHGRATCAAQSRLVPLMEFWHRNSFETLSARQRTTALINPERPQHWVEWGVVLAVSVVPKWARELCFSVSKGNYYAPSFSRNFTKYFSSHPTLLWSATIWFITQRGAVHPTGSWIYASYGAGAASTHCLRRSLTCTSPNPHRQQQLWLHPTFPAPSASLSVFTKKIKINPTTILQAWEQKSECYVDLFQNAL